MGTDCGNTQQLHAWKGVLASLRRDPAEAADTEVDTGGVLASDDLGRGIDGVMDRAGVPGGDSVSRFLDAVGDGLDVAADRVGDTVEAITRRILPG